MPADTEPQSAPTAVRFKDKDEGIIEGLIIPFFGPFGNGDLDLYATRFSPKTDLGLSLFPNGGRPGLYMHGIDEDVQTEVIGREIRSRPTDKGIWMEAQIDRAHRYAEEILDLVGRGMLSLSSGAIDHLVSINKATRDVERWPWVEWSLVPNPGNPEALIYHVRSTEALRHLPEDERGDIAVRIIEAEAQEEGEQRPEPSASVEDLTTAVRDLALRLSPASLHSLAVEMGHRCQPPVAETEEPEAAPIVAIRGDAPEAVPASDVELDAIRSALEVAAIAKAKSLLS